MMVFFLGISFVISFGISILIFSTAIGALQEIEGIIYLLISFVCLIGAGVIDTLSQIRDGKH